MCLTLLLLSAFVPHTGIHLLAHKGALLCISLWCGATFANANFLLFQGAYDEQQLVSLNPPSGPVDVWLGGCEPRISQDEFLVAYISEKEA